MIVRELRALWSSIWPLSCSAWRACRLSRQTLSPDGSLTVWVVTDHPGTAACSDCGTRAARVHEHVLARPRDVRRGADEVRVAWLKRRWKCGNDSVSAVCPSQGQLCLLRLPLVLASERRSVSWARSPPWRPPVPPRPALLLVRIRQCPRTRADEKAGTRTIETVRIHLVLR